MVEGLTGLRGGKTVLHRTIPGNHWEVVDVMQLPDGMIDRSWIQVR